MQKCLENVLILATSGHENCAMITNRRILTAQIYLYGMSSFHFYHWNQFKLITLPSTLRIGKKVPPRVSLSLKFWRLQATRIPQL